MAKGGKAVAVVSIERVQSRILLIRGQKVILDSDLADLYGVPTKRLNEQVKRNSQRFPADFMFQLAKEEKAEVVANCDHLNKLKFSPVLPYAFTEHAARLKRLETTVDIHDHEIVAIVDAIRLLMPPPEEPPREPFGFRRAKKN